MKALKVILVFLSLAVTSSAQHSGSDKSIEELERKLDEAARLVNQLSNTVELLRAEISRLKNDKLASTNSVAWAFAGNLSPGICLPRCSR